MTRQSPFYQIPKQSHLYSGNHFFIIKDKYPVNEGHLLIVSKELRQDFFELTEAEKEELPKLIHKAKEIIEYDHSPDGYNIGMNCGETAGQTVFHFHCHIIPRYEGDMKNPRGGVRHCVEGKGYY